MNEELNDFIIANKAKSSSDGYKEYHYKIRDLVRDGKIDELKLLLDLSSKADLDSARLRSILIMIDDITPFHELPHEPIKLMENRLKILLNRDPLY